MTTAIPVVLSLLVACGDETPIDNPFGETAIVAVVNPPENEGNTAGLPTTFGDASG